MKVSVEIRLASSSLSTALPSGQDFSWQLKVRTICNHIPAIFKHFYKTMGNLPAEERLGWKEFPPIGVAKKADHHGRLVEAGPRSLSVGKALDIHPP